MHFKNKTIWITGASSGIGAELARQLAAQQATLILTARNEAALAEVQAYCLQHTAKCILLPADVTDGSKWTELCSKAISLHGGIDVIIHSAGASQRSLASETDMEVYRRLMELNFFAPVGITQALIRLQKRALQITVLSSMAGLMGFPMRTGYAAAKHALHGYFETLQSETMGSNLHITIVSPGRIKTPISLSAFTGNGSVHGKMDEGQLNGIPVERCAFKIILAMESKKRHIIIAKEERLLYWIWWFARPLYYRIAARKGMEPTS